jgi:integrase
VRARITKRVVAALKPGVAPFDCRDIALKGFLLRVQPSGRKTWFYQYRTPSGQQTRLALGTWPGMSPEGARSIASERALEAGRGIDLVGRKREKRAEGSRAKQSTLRAFLDNRYAPWAQAHLKSADFQLRRIRSDFADWFDRPMHEFNEFAIEGLRQKWKKAGMQPRSINRDIQRLQSVLSRAVAWGVLDAHPFKGLKPLKTDKHGRVRFLDADEESALRKALASREANLRKARTRFNAWRVARGRKPLPKRNEGYVDHLRPLVLVALNTGLRRGELLELRWSDVNLPGKLLTVAATSAKSGNTRHIPLNSEAMTVLTAWRKESKGELVFPGPEGKRMARIDTAWNSLVIGAKIRNFRLHDCRHHFASRLVQAGVDLNTVRELLGHSEIKTTLIYSHLAPSNLRAAVEAI